MVYIAHSHDHRGESENQWAHVASHWINVRVITYEDIPEDVPLVLLAPKEGYIVKGDISLPDFNHPEDVCYVFGSDHRHFQLDWIPRDPDWLVHIPLSGYPEMYSWVSCAVVLYDRTVKRG